MNCSETKELLSQYVDDVLDQKTALRVEEHCRTCAACAEELQSLQGYMRRMRSLQQVRAPADFTEKVRARIYRKPFYRRLFEALVQQASRKAAWEVVGVAAAAVIVMVIVYPFQQHTPQRADTKRMRPEAEVSTGGEETYEQDQTASFREAVPAPRAPLPAPAREKRSAVKALGTAAKKDFSPPVPAVSGRGAGAPGAPGETVFGTEKNEKQISSPVLELVLHLKAKAAGTSYSVRREAARDRKMMTRKKTDAAEQQSRVPALSGSAEKSDRRQHVADQVKALVAEAAGTVVSDKYDGGPGQPYAIDAEIPASRYGAFAEKARTLGDLQVTGDPPAFNRSGTMTIRITILLAD